ncbi:ATP-dependent DNA helicase PcrA [Caprobacter fermentans]|uniref:DNA 3'-5' helicase n=1 Tax=Caproicibacter fermentans TaxID=2576756 RepID=A0A6N8HUN1_9FIRM|nr:UvrD-helicase domain-containing protein [Caproicibacter fermentans]MVB09501.1 ATP-dependent DNA helicase PcrA [Caproicibacter fermentans]
MSKNMELRKKVLEKEFSRMNAKQREAVFTVNGPLLILAGAGSGKTTVLVNRIANLVRYGNAYQSLQEPSLTPDETGEVTRFLESGQQLSPQTRDRLADDPCPPWRILAITFTNKAAEELKNRLGAMLGEVGDEVWASTFHSSCARMLRKDGERLGFTRHFTIYDTDDSRRVIKDCQKKLGIDDKKLSYKAILAEISRAKDSLIGPDEYIRDAGGDERVEKIGAAYRLYQAALKNSDAMDFDDLIVHTIRMFQQNPDVLDYYQNRFRYFLVDEYQDTSHAQYVFIKMLAQKSGNLCVVGDDDQSIYKFRGATVENILSFEKTFPNAKVIRLEQNYRSTKTILAAANAVIANNENRKGKTLWTENQEGKKIQARTASSEQDEASFIADRILEGVASGRRFSDFAVLYRMNTQSNALEKVFAKSGIKYRIIGGQRFYDRREIRDMTAYLNVINNPDDEVRLQRIINRPKRSIGDKTIAQASEIAAQLGESLFSVISHADEFDPLKRSAPKLLVFSQMIQELSETASDGKTGLGELYQQLLQKTGYLDALLASGEEDAQDRADNVRELSTNLIKYEEDNGEEASLSGFLEEVSLLTDIDNYDGSSDAAVLMTMHSAKGLEFPVVFLPGFEEGIFPGMQVLYNPGEVEEERRLAYVAITRAKEELYILNSEYRMLFGSSLHNLPSRFLREVPEELLEKSRSRDWKKPKPGVVLPTSAREARAVTTEAARNFGPAFTPAEETKVVFRTGDGVVHKTFGPGVVLSASSMGNDTLLEIAFDKAGTKKLMANFARLQKI